MWCPDYFGNDLLANAFCYKSELSSTVPVNDATFGSNQAYGGNATSYFTGNTTTSGYSSFLRDPAADLLEESLVQDARQISSCISITYTGKMSDASGQFCSVPVLPLSSVLQGGTGGGPLSVDDVFRYASNAQRLGIDTIETISRTSEETHHFRDEADAPILIPNAAGAIPTETTDLGEAQQPHFFVIAWRGLDAGASNPLVFELYKNIEWRPSPVSGLAHQPPNSFAFGPQMQKVKAFLDTIDPDWQTKIKNAAVSMASAAVTLAKTGVQRKFKTLNLRGSGVKAHRPGY